MSAIRKSINKVKQTVGHVRSKSHSPAPSPTSTTYSNGSVHVNGVSFADDQIRSRDSTGTQRGHVQAKEDEAEKKIMAQLQREKQIKMRRMESEGIALKTESPEMRARYGQAETITNPKPYPASLTGISSKDIGSEIAFRARIHTIRSVSSKLAFFVFRQQTTTLQGVLSEELDTISGHMVRWAERLPSESIVLVTGVLQEPKGVEEVVGATIHDTELLIHTLHVLAQPTKHLPFTVYEAQEESIKAKESQDEENRHNITDRTRLTHRLIDLRTPASQSIFRINAAVCNLFRTHLNELGFIEIHTPKLQGGATESGASVFEVSYFNRAAFLAQSPQLAKQMCISADFNRVYEIGPVFRAENSNTHRHLTEYVGLDIEMALQESYYEAMDVIDDTLKAIFKGIYDRYRRELEIVKLRFPHEDLVWLEETPRIPFAEGIQMLAESGWKNEDGSEPSPEEDLSTRAEIRLGELVKEKYGTDYYILDKFPTDARPFYTMRDPTNPKVTNSFDIFLRGQEITTGGQRQHDAQALKARMRELNISVHSMEEYIDGFEYGAPPHAGCGIGLERIIMLLLNLGNVRFASLFPRDPKSLPARPPVLELPHPEASTNPPPWRSLEATADADTDERAFQPLEKLIANYGDATNTSWLDERYHVWRHHDTGAAVGYVPSSHKTAIVVGDPLCDPSQRPRVIEEYLSWLRTELKLKPIWLLISEEVEEYLAGHKGWHTLTCVAEQKIDKPSAVDAAYDKTVQKKLRHAQAEGIKIVEFPPFKLPPEDVVKKVDDRVRDWQNNRKGEQVHLTNIRPWIDPSHRRYFSAEDKEGNIHAFVVMHQLSPLHGYQVKFSLDFPGAPSGSIEYAITEAIKAVAASGARSVTFGAGASTEFKPVHGVDGMRVKMLSKAYADIARRLKLGNKSEFKQKLGAENDEVYIAYPPDGLGLTGVKAIMDFFQEDDPEAK